MPASPKKQQAAFFAEESFRESREFLRAGVPLPARVDQSTFDHLQTLGGYLFERDNRRFADWTHRIYQEIGPSARPHAASVWARLPRRFSEAFESVVSPNITSAERAELAVIAQELSQAWQRAESERTQPGGMMHGHYCSSCGSEFSEDSEECVLGTRTQCDQCREKELYGHGHLCPRCGRKWACQCQGCMDEVQTSCGDCQGLESRTAPAKEEKFSSLLLMASVSTISTVVGFIRLPYDMYVLLRFAFCITAAVGFASALEKRARAWLWVFGTCVVLYNPIQPIHFHSKINWEVINILTVGLFWAAVYQFRRRTAKGLADV